MPKWKAIFPKQVRFSRNFGFLRRFLRLAGKIFGFLKTPFVLLIVLKTTASIPRFQCKNRFQKRPTVGGDYWEKTKWDHGLVWHAMFKTFLQISRPTVVHFSNRFLNWNRGIETVILSTIKGTNKVKKIEIFVHVPQKLTQKPKIVERSGEMAIHSTICNP